MIRKCDLTLKSIVDGTENSFFAEGRLEDFGEKIKVCYREDPAVIHVTFQDGKAWVDRDGDYSLRLELSQGEVTKGEIGINDNVGELEIRTHAIEFSYRGDGLTARLKYDILLGEGAQEMELHIQANVRE